MSSNRLKLNLIKPQCLFVATSRRRHLIDCSAIDVSGENINPLAAEFIYLATSAECSGPINPRTAVKGIDFVKKIKWRNYNIFAFLCIFDDFFSFCVFFVCNKQNPKILTKRLPVATTVPSGTQHHHLGHWYTGVYLRIFDPDPSNPTTFLGLCSLDDYRQSIESPMGILTFNSTEKALKFTIYYCILRLQPRQFDIWRNLSLWLQSLFT